MGRGSSKVGGGKGGGGAKLSTQEQAQLDAIVNTIAPDPVYGRISAKITNQAGKDIDKMMNVGDEFVVTWPDGTKFTYEKYSNGWFKRDGMVWDYKDIGRNIAVFKYPSPQLPPNNVKFTIRKKNK